MNQLRKIKFILREVTVFFLIYILVFQFFRIGIFCSYSDLFDDIDIYEFVKILYLGLRFDLSSISILLFIPIIILIFPLKITTNLFFRRTLTSFIFLELLAVVIFLASDFFYFSFVKRHITNEINFLFNDPEYLMTEVSVKFLPVFLLLIVTFTCYPFFLKLTCSRKKEIKRSILGFFIIFIFFIILGRGGLQRKPIAVIDAYQYGAANKGHLILNGIFTASHFSNTSEFLGRKAGNENQYLKTLNIEKPKNPKYPLQRTNIQKLVDHEKNLIVIMIESLSFKYIDQLSGKNYGVTPNIDKLAREGLVFKNFFANGQRSVDGTQSILTGIPPLPGMPDITALSINYSSLGILAKKNDFRTIFLTSTLRESFSLDLIAGAVGFDEYYGLEDYPIILDYIDSKDRTLGWDYDVLIYLLKILENEESNYFAFINASSNHTPFAKMHAPFNKYEHGRETEGGYLNMLNYTDWALGEFINTFKKRKDFENTIFIITSDHAIAHFQGSDPYGKFKIPLIIFSPKHFPQGESEKYVSQIDLFPTIIKILNLKGEYSSIGEDILENKEKFAVVKDGALINIFSKDGFLIHSLKKVLQYKPLLSNGKEFLKNNLASRAIAFDHLTYILLTQNRWFKPQINLKK